MRNGIDFVLFSNSVIEDKPVSVGRKFFSTLK